jgi:hypothetical protein
MELTKSTCFSSVALGLVVALASCYGVYCGVILRRLQRRQSGGGLRGSPTDKTGCRVEHEIAVNSALTRSYSWSTGVASPVAQRNAGGEAGAAQCAVTYSNCGQRDDGRCPTASALVHWMTAGRYGTARRAGSRPYIERTGYSRLRTWTGVTDSPPTADLNRGSEEG